MRAWLVLIAFGFALALPRIAAATPPSDPHVRPLDAQPRWLARYCERKTQLLRAAILCPTRVPTDFTPTPNTRSLFNDRTAYVLDAGGFNVSGGQTSHWVIGGFRGRRKRGLGDWTTVSALRSVGAAAVRGRRGRWYLGGGGLFEGHLMLVWQEHGWVYAVSDHIGYPFNSGRTVGVGSRPLRSEMLRIAAAMRLYSP